MTERTPDPPDWTVVIPTFNRPAALRQTLAALERLTSPEGGHEIIVVDDGGEADLGFVAQAPRTRLLVQANAGPAAARNAGAHAAHGRFIAFTDDDCRPHPDWLLRLAGHLRAAPDRLVGGVAVNGLPGNRFSAASQTLVDAFTTWENRSTAPRFFCSNNLAVAREAFLALGGFDSGFRLAAAEDRRLCHAWAAFGGKLVPAPDAVVEHFHELDFGQFWRQQANYGRGARTLAERTGGTAVRGAGARLELTLHLLCAPRRMHARGAGILTGLIALSQAAAAWGFASEAARLGRLRLATRNQPRARDARKAER